MHSFLAQLVSGVDPFPGLERVVVVGGDPDGRVHLMHLILFVRVYLHLTQQRIFACLGEFPAECLPLVVDIHDKSFVARSSIRTVPQVDHVTHLGGIYLPDCQTKPCERAVKTVGKEYVDLAC